MFPRKFLFSSLFIFTALALTLRIFSKSGLTKPASQNVSPSQLSDTSDFAAIDAYVEQQRHRLHMPAVALAIVQGDKIVHRHGFGNVHPNGLAPCPQTPFYIGSLTKSFTALAVMQLVEAGKIHLDDPVRQYLPWFRVADAKASNQMTVRHLLNQTGGLPTSCGEIPLADFDNSPAADERQTRALATLALKRPVGSAFEYCNANYTLLGLIIQTVSGESYADYIQQHILNPLGMSHTYTSRLRAEQHGLATGHQYWFAVPIPAPNLPMPYGSLSAGLLISTAQDLAQYLIALLNGGRAGDAQILSQAGIEELRRGVAEFGAMGLKLGKYGMGWFVTEMDGSKLVWHSGTLPNFGAYMALLPEQKKGVVLLFNANHHWMNPVLIEFGTGVTALLAGAPPTRVPFVGMIPSALRAQLLIPAIQVAIIAVALQRLYRRRTGPESFRKGGRTRLPGLLLLLTPDFFAGLTLFPFLGKRRGYLMLYMPDYARVAVCNGCLALVWSVICMGLMLRARQES